MRHLSPLRYPGGEAAMGPAIAQLLSECPPRPTTFVELFAGGAGAGLRLLHMGAIDRLVLNDADPGVAAFWRSVITQPEALAERIESTAPTIAEWHHHKERFDAGAGNDLDLGFSTFYLNRTNRSGGLRSRPIGGLDQTGRWGIDARFNGPELANRVRVIGALQDRVSVYQLDWRDFLAEVYPTLTRPLLFVDPPYPTKGRTLYPTRMTISAHEDLAVELSALQRWITTYHPDDPIADMYREHQVSRIPVNYRAGVKRGGHEIVIASGDLPALSGPAS